MGQAVSIFGKANLAQTLSPVSGVNPKSSPTVAAPEPLAPLDPGTQAAIAASVGGSVSAATSGLIYLNQRETNNQSLRNQNQQALMTYVTSPDEFVAQDQKLKVPLKKTLTSVKHFQSKVKSDLQKEPDNSFYQKMHENSVYCVENLEKSIDFAEVRKSGFSHYGNDHVSLTPATETQAPQVHVQTAVSSPATFQEKKIDTTVFSGSKGPGFASISSSWSNPPLTERYVAVSPPSPPVYSEPKPNYFLSAALFASVCLSGATAFVLVKNFFVFWSNSQNYEQKNLVYTLLLFKEGKISRNQALYVLRHQWLLEPNLAERFLDDTLSAEDINVNSALKIN